MRSSECGMLATVFRIPHSEFRMAMLKSVSGGVTAAQGFLAAGVSAGIKKSRKPDLALVACPSGAAAAAVFTRNRVQAAPVLISRSRARRGTAKAVVINSGCANCLTGPAGRRDALAVSRAVERALALKPQDVLLASTGVIGQRLPVGRVVQAVPALVASLSRAHHGAAAEAILTTDLQAKEAAVEAAVGGRRFVVGGMAKGAGMIAPSMATMLCVLTTDAAVPAGVLKRVLRQAAAATFNRISVDGDMSTNDTVFGLASGHAGVRVGAAGPAQRLFARAVEAVMRELALMLVRDGEGATRMMAVEVTGARSDAEADRCARQIAQSPLVKTMLAGADPNVGRIAAAAGASLVAMDPRRLEIWIGPRRVVARGEVLSLPARVAEGLLQQDVVAVRVALHAGSGRGRMVTCDLTEDYVHINARYTT